jgi:hypothetical protein
MTKTHLIVLALVATLVSPSYGQGITQVQEKNARKGFWFSGGLGVGSVGADCDDCSDDRSTGFSSNIRLGGTLGGGRFLLGGEAAGWIRSESGIDQNMAFTSFVFVWYPSRTGAFFLKLGLGGMYYKADDGVDELTATAPAGSFGLGYDFRVARNLSLTPYFNSLATSSVEAKFNGVSIPGLDLTTNLVQLGLAISVH